MGRSSVQLSAVVRGFFLGGVLCVTAACHQGGGTVVAPLLVADEKPNFENCDPKFVAETQDLVAKGSTAGPLADYAKKTNWVESNFFGKPYDRYDIEAVADLPTISTAMYVKSLGVTLHKIPRASMDGQCPMYYYLQAAPPKLQAIWNEQAGNTSNGMSLAGLFFEYCGSGGLPACHDRNMISPTILVDEATSRWTIVHEMMHYNFDQGRKASMTTPPDSYLARATKGYGGDFKKAYEAFMFAPNRGDLKDAVGYLRKLVEIGKETFVRRALEEVAIEGMLVDLWADGTLTNVRAPSSDVRYMVLSRDQFIATLPPFEKFAAELKKAAEENFWPELADEAEETVQLLKSQRAETKAMIDTAVAKIREKQGFNADDEFAPMLGFFGGKDSEDFNIVKAETEAYAHFASHDQDGLQSSFTKLAQELAEELL